MIALQARGLSHRYQRRWVFRELSFDLPAGEALCVTGPNGSGKSTLLRILAGQLRPTGGEVAAAVADVPTPPEAMWRRVSWAAPYVEHFPYLELQEAFAFHHRLRPLLFPPVECLRLLRMEAHAAQTLGRLSSGLRQRALVGLALFTRADLLLLDEPTSFLDPQNTAFLLDLIAAHQAGRTLVVASNLPAEFERFPQRLTLAG